MLEIEELKSVMGVLKRLFKERGISYREVGVRLGLSESGVKKVFASADISYVRLAQMAEILGLKILDILEEIQEATFENVRFTGEQQEQFLKDPRLFAVFYKLVIERLSVEQTSQQLRLTESKTFSYLRRLDELQMIELYEGGKIKIPPLRMVRTFGDGPFLSKIYRDWGHAMVSDLADPKNQASGKFIVRCVKMKDDTYNEFCARLREIDTEFTRRGIREMSTSMQDLKPMRWISLTDGTSFVNGTELHDD